MKVAFITAQTPYGRGEQFILPEILEFVHKGNEAIVMPIRPAKELGMGTEALKVSEYCKSIPLLSLGVILESLRVFANHPVRVLQIVYEITKFSGSAIKALKNITVLPKGLVTGEVIIKNKVDHIHAHWASTPSTVAYIASRLSGVPWSFTSHRWDITENNMMSQKVKTAEFVRAISKNGRREIIGYAGSKYASKVFVIHTGINIDTLCREVSEKVKKDKFVIAVPANLIQVKGHRYLIEAVKLLCRERNDFVCWFYGEGPLKDKLENYVRKLGLQNTICFKGKIAHNELLNLYSRGSIDCVILPSITTESGEKEGIPVSLMEAMAFGIPVISTNTGSIPELLDDGAGIMVSEKDPDELAGAISRLMDNQELQYNLKSKGCCKIKEQFSLPLLMDNLISMMQKSVAYRISNITVI